MSFMLAEGQASSAISLGAAVTEGASVLTKAGIDQPRRRARRLIAAVLDLSPAAVIAHPERLLGADEQARLATAVARAAAGEPLSRIVGEREFWGLAFRLSPETLDPRPDSETLVEAVLKRLPEPSAPLRCLDLGTGTGCLLLALLSEFPRASGIGIDIADGAVRAARDNAAALGLAGRARFVVGDWANAVAGPFDAIVANPPYIAAAALAALPSEVAAYDPHLALDGGADGLAAYRAIAADLPRLLARDGLFAGEIGDGQADTVAALLAAAGLAIDGVVPDLAGIARCIVARRTAPAAARKK
jgi:release factor glutamine methyltransferase